MTNKSNTHNCLWKSENTYK